MAKSTTSNISIRMDSNLKAAAEALYEELGMNLSTAFNIFVRQSLRTGGIPFKITAQDDGFNNRYNQMKLHAAAKRMNEGKGVVHEIMDDTND